MREIQPSTSEAAVALEDPVPSTSSASTVTVSEKSWPTKRELFIQIRTDFHG